MTDNEQGDYKTTYIKSLQQPAKYPSAHYHRHLNNGALSNSSLEMIFAAQYTRQSATKLGRMGSNERRRLGVELIQRRWRGDCTINKRSGLIDVEECSDYEGNENIVDNQETKRRKRPRVDSLSSMTNNKFNNNSAATTLTSTSIEPKLLFRRTSSHLSHSNARYYNDVHFLHSSSVVIGVDNYGDLDIVRVPSFSGGRISNGRSNNDFDDGASDDDGGGEGVGKLQAGRISIFSNNNNESNNNGPRQAMSQFHYELFGYDNGDKFAVGTRCGRVQLFATERATNGSAVGSAHGNNNASRCRNNTAVGSTNALWSSLPTISTSIGPRRRYYKSDKCPLYTMLSNNNNDKNSIFDAYNTSYLEEIPHWDNDDDNFLTSNTVQGSECPWAFRENGTSLLGACVDANNGDCFSLRVLDERCGLESSIMNVIVADCERNAGSKAKSRGSNSGEAVDRVCFSGQFGLVTSHRVWDNYLTPASSCLKWWDHRMLRSHQPTNTMCLSFPRDNVSLMSPDMERFFSSSTNFPHRRSDPLPTLYELSMDQQNWNDARFKVYNVNRLVGSRDLSDRIAIQSIVNGCKDEILMVDSCRGEVTQRIRLDKLANGVSPSISSYLETMACVTTENEGQEQVMCIYDVSRQRKDLNENDPYLDTYTNNSGRKRHLLSGGMSNDDSMYNGDLLRMLSPKVHDIYGIDSSLTCLTIDECGDTIACGTSDGDIFVLNSSDLGDLTESE